MGEVVRVARKLPRVLRLVGDYLHGRSLSWQRNGHPQGDSYIIVYIIYSIN
jgi:hypothetical protein